MKIKKNSRNGFLIVICCILSALIALSVTEMVMSSIVQVETESQVMTDTVNYLERSSVAFEDSSFFEKSLSHGVEDISRMAVIRHQLETNGKYDPAKKVDVLNYANRTKATQPPASSAVYKLDDLVKWGNYGYDYQVISGTNAQLDSYFYALQSGDMNSKLNDFDTVHIESLDEGQDISDLIESNMSEAQEYEASIDEGMHSMYILVDRYKTVDGKSLITKADNRADYENLVQCLCKSADELFYNYTDYSRLVSDYAPGATNLLYCYQIVNADGTVHRYSNLGQNVTAMTNDELSKIFTENVRYICFNPDKLQLATNAKGITPQFMKSVLSSYEYAFGDGSRIWIAIDDSYEADDVFLQAKNIYEKNDPMFIPACILLVAASLLLILFVVIMTIQAGKATQISEDGEKTVILIPGKMDNIAMEIFFAIVIIAALLICGLIAVTGEIMIDKKLYITDQMLLYGVFAAEAVLTAAVLLPLYLCLVRKIKCRLMWNGSIIRWICLKIKEGVIDFYDNGQSIVRIWLPFLLFLSFNLVMVLLGVGGIVIAFILDMIVGVWLYKESKTRETILDGITTISDGDLKHKIDVKGMHGDNLALANAVNNIGDGIDKAVDASMRNEKMKADLITNVSHDIKTPLTSIINFVDLLKRENIQDERIKGYIEVLDQKSQRLKALTNDLVEASKISSGNISLTIDRLNLVELINQSVGEFCERFEEKGLKMVINLPKEPVYIMADSRGIFRVVENLYSNIYKYALENTRVYVDMNIENNHATLVFKNISAEPLNVNSGDLTERFIRGDVSRRTDGSGLGLSIAKSLTEAMGGSFDVALDGDLFKVIVTFEIA